MASLWMLAVGVTGPADFTGPPVAPSGGAMLPTVKNDL